MYFLSRSADVAPVGGRPHGIHARHVCVLHLYQTKSGAPHAGSGYRRSHWTHLRSVVPSRTLARSTRINRRFDCVAIRRAPVRRSTVFTICGDLVLQHRSRCRRRIQPFRVAGPGHRTRRSACARRDGHGDPPSVRTPSGHARLLRRLLRAMAGALQHALRRRRHPVQGRDSPGRLGDSPQ